MIRWSKDFAKEQTVRVKLMRAGGLLRVSPEDRQRKGAGEKGQGGMVARAVENAEKWTPHRRGVSSQHLKLPDGGSFAGHV